MADILYEMLVWLVCGMFASPLIILAVEIIRYRPHKMTEKELLEWVNK